MTIKKGIVYTGVVVFTAAFCLILFTALRALFETMPVWAGIAATIVTLVLISATFNTALTVIQRVADGFFYGRRAYHRRILLDFTNVTKNVLDIGELAETMLRPITNTMNAKYSSLLLECDDYYVATYAEQMLESESVTPIKLHKGSPVTTWLGREDRPLSIETINLNSAFKRLRKDERNALNTADIELLFPINSKHRLVGILVLGKMHTRGRYSHDDVDLLMTACHQASVALNNAVMYTGARDRANVDELTEVFNHSYFHERLDEEIARCSRFGSIFSLVFLDLDLFKTYNDICGHLAGDVVLKEIGQHLKALIRSIDIVCRFGGDEFAVILPQTTLGGAYVVAEKIRRMIETQMSGKEVLLTCSIGVSAWPADGLMREDIIQMADTALYCAKRNGGNRVYRASELAQSDVRLADAALELQDSPAVLSIIYALAATVDAKDHYTYGHSKKVSKYATDIAHALGYPLEGIDRIRTAALLHDIGKLGISDNLLAKPGPLSVEELALMRAHPNIGVSILKHIDTLKPCLPGVLYHHERYDGTGYPAGLKGENIPRDARILAVADSYDAITSKRPYRNERLTSKDAIAELEQCAGTQFDPAIVEAFAHLAYGDLLFAQSHRYEDP